MIAVPVGTGSTTGSTEGTTGDQTTTGTQTSSFSLDIHELVLDGCEYCHSPNGTASSSAFILLRDIDADYKSVLKWVNLERPGQSALLSLTAGQGHGGGIIYPAGSESYGRLATWIQQGAGP